MITGDDNYYKVICYNKDEDDDFTLAVKQEFDEQAYDEMEHARYAIKISNFFYQKEKVLADFDIEMWRLIVPQISKEISLYDEKMTKIKEIKKDDKDYKDIYIRAAKRLNKTLLFNEAGNIVMDIK